MFTLLLPLILLALAALLCAALSRYEDEHLEDSK